MTCSCISSILTNRSGGSITTADRVRIIALMHVFASIRPETAQTSQDALFMLALGSCCRVSGKCLIDPMNAALRQPDISKTVAPSA